MGYIYMLSRAGRLRRSRCRTVKEWKAGCRSVKRRRRLLRWSLAAVAAGELLWFKEGQRIGGWLRGQWPDLRYIEERGPAVQGELPDTAVQGELPDTAGAQGELPDTAAQPGETADRISGGDRPQAAVKRGVSILLDEKSISIFQVEEGCGKQE